MGVNKTCLFGVTVLTGALITACSQDTSVADAPPALPPTAALLGEQTVKSVAEYRAEPRYREADVKNGEREAVLCRACHTLERGAATMIGPNLFGMFGKRAGFAANYDYSSALADADLIWTPRALDAWLAAPHRFLPGNRMTFPGISNAQARNDLIAYLLNISLESGAN